MLRVLLELLQVEGGGLRWAADSRQLYFGCGPGKLCRVEPDAGDGDVESDVDSSGLMAADVWWSVDPEGRIIRLRHLSTSDIYAWDLKMT